MDWKISNSIGAHLLSGRLLHLHSLPAQRSSSTGKSPACAGLFLYLFAEIAYRTVFDLGTFTLTGTRPFRSRLAAFLAFRRADHR